MQIRPLLIVGALALVLTAPASGHFSDCSQELRVQLLAEFDTGSEYEPPAGTPKFVFSNNYPTSLSNVEPQSELPWEFFDYETQPREYLHALLDYCFAGNIAADGSFNFNGIVDNTEQRWYHAPWLHSGRAGREPINGLTAELAAEPGYLGPGQQRTVQNWAVGYYNELGAVTFGDVWRDPAQPALTRGIFPNGTVSFKLLFTEATPQEVPQLAGTFTIPALIRQRKPDGTIDKERRVDSPVDMHLIQIDLAVKDPRSDETGWVFGTFVYDGESPGTTWRERLVPLGLAWGNDPTCVEGTDAQLTETWINNEAGAKWMNAIRTRLGHGGRLNGPLDNQASSCISCHSTAQYPPAPLTWADRDKLDPAGRRQYSPTYSGKDEMYWFRNIPAGKPFRAGDFTSDYSLQLSKGIVAYNTWLANNCTDRAVELDVEDSVSRACQLPVAAGGTGAPEVAEVLEEQGAEVPATTAP
jgi:hypothetical protein